jgi:hypothetical protein
MKDTMTASNGADYRTRRRKDEKDEAIVAQYLDKYFYPNWTTTSTRNTDKETQVAGLDITVVDFKGDEITIDEKAATRWIGRSLTTFSHEISSIDVTGREYDGWLLDFDSASDYLLEVWIDDAKDTSLNDYKDITDATIALVPKKNIWNYLKKRGIKSGKLKELGSEMRDRNMPYFYYQNLKMTQQTNQQEHAVNILIPRDSIINYISTYAVRIKDGKITTLRKAF